MISLRRPHPIALQRIFNWRLSLRCSLVGRGVNSPSGRSGWQWLPAVSFHSQAVDGKEGFKSMLLLYVYVIMVKRTVGVLVTRDHSPTRSDVVVELLQQLV
eukprot:scaffold3123_cov119-Cylindrotheca_fusiformis.AAC.3